MMMILGIAQFLVIASITIYEFKYKSPAVFLWATLLIMFGIMHMINSFTGDQVYPDSVMISASLFAIGFCIMYVLVRIIYIRSRRYTARNYFIYENIKENMKEENTHDSLLFFIFLLAMALKLIPYMRYVGSILSSSWSTGRDYSATLGYVNTEQIARIFVYSLSGLTAVLYIKRNKKWIIVSAIVLFGVLLSRNRIEILPLLCSIIAIFLYKTDRLRIRTIILAAISAVAVIYIVYALRVFRHYGTVQDFINNFDFAEFNAKIRLYLATDNGELGLRRDFYYFINGKNNFEDFGKLHSYIRMLFVYLPTSWSFGLKPSDFAIAMGQATGMVAGGSTHPTLFGDCYANLGAFGICLGSFWAIYVSVIDSIIVKRSKTFIQILLFILNAVVYVIIGRGSVYNGFWFAAYGIPLLIFLNWFFEHVRLPVIVIGKKRL